MREMIERGMELANEGQKAEAYEMLTRACTNLDESNPDHRKILGIVRTRLAALCNDLDRSTEAADHAEWVLKNTSPDVPGMNDETTRMMLQVLLHMAGRDPMMGREKPKKGGCFIATASYGSPLAPEVTTLRQFRDEVLLSSKVGRAFVAFYYFVSPPLASLISRHSHLQAATRRFLLEPILYFIKKGGK